MALTYLNRSLIALCLRIIAVGYVLAQQRHTAAVLMYAQTFQNLFSVLYPTPAIRLPIDTLTFVTIQISVQLDLKCHLQKDEMKIINLKDGVVSLLRPILVVGNFVAVGDACGIPRPFFGEPVISLAHRYIKWLRILIRCPHPEDRGKRPQTLEPYQALPINRKAALDAELNEPICS